MPLFRRSQSSQANYNAPLLDDIGWLEAGHSRYDKLIVNHYGSPDTIAAGGARRTAQSDHASALFFYQKAIDTLHSIYVCGFRDTGPNSWARQPSPRDFEIIDAYLDTLAYVRQVRTHAPVEKSVIEVTHRLRAISSQFKRYRLDPRPYLDRLAILGRLAPDVDVSKVFWN